MHYILCVIVGLAMSSCVGFLVFCIVQVLESGKYKKQCGWVLLSLLGIAIIGISLTIGCTIRH